MYRQLPAHSPLPAAAILAAGQALLRSDGSGIAALEAALSSRYGARTVLLTDSGTSALSLALSSVQKLRPGPLVALPAYCCYDIVTAAIGAGMKVHLYDVDPRTIGPDLHSLSTALDRGASAVVVAHLYGYPVEMAPVRALCEARGALLIEDAAQGAGASLQGRLLGTWGDVSVLSFGRGKGITGGGGGALLANDPDSVELLDAARTRLSPTGNTRVFTLLAAQWLLARPRWYGIPASMPFLKLGQTVYHDPWPPARMAPVAAAALSTTLPLAEAEANIRRRNASRLQRAISAIPVFTTVTHTGASQPGYLRLPVTVSDRGRAALSGATARRLGVMPGYPKPLSDLDVLRPRLANATESLPGANRLARDLFTLPTHSLLSEKDLVDLETLIRAASSA